MLTFVAAIHRIMFFLITATKVSIQVKILKTLFLDANMLGRRDYELTPYDNRH